MASSVRPCTICETGLAKRNPLFCEACLSFYKRNRNRTDLLCKRGALDFRCLQNCDDYNEEEKDQTKFNKTTKTGLVRRFLCPACRMVKCRRVISNDVIERELTNYDNNQQISCFNTVVKAASNFVYEMANEPCRNSLLHFNTYFEAHHFYTKTMVLSQINVMKKFASQFDFYKNLTVADRSKIFLETTLTMVAGEGLIHPEQHLVGAFSKQNFQYFSNIFPQPSQIFFNNLNVQAKDTWNIVQSNQFTTVENAFFLTFLFFCGKFLILFYFFYFNFE